MIPPWHHQFEWSQHTACGLLADGRICTPIADAVTCRACLGFISQPGHAAHAERST